MPAAAMVGQRGFASRVGWHAGLAWRASRIAALMAGVGGTLLRLVLPVQDVWVAGAVAGASALVALALIAIAEKRHAPIPAEVRDPAAALEKVGAADQAAHALARAALVLGAFAVGVALGGALGLGRA